MVPKPLVLDGESQSAHSIPSYIICFCNKKKRKQKRYRKGTCSIVFFMLPIVLGQVEEEKEEKTIEKSHENQQNVSLITPNAAKYFPLC